MSVKLELSVRSLWFIFYPAASRNILEFRAVLAFFRGKQAMVLGRGRRISVGISLIYLSTVPHDEIDCTA